MKSKNVNNMNSIIVYFIKLLKIEIIEVLAYHFLRHFTYPVF